MSRRVSEVGDVEVVIRVGDYRLFVCVRVYRLILFRNTELPGTRLVRLQFQIECRICFEVVGQRLDDVDSKTKLCGPICTNTTLLLHELSEGFLGAKTGMLCHVTGYRKDSSV
jgi:hypothetical protein